MRQEMGILPPPLPNDGPAPMDISAVTWKGKGGKGSWYKEKDAKVVRVRTKAKAIGVRVARIVVKVPKARVILVAKVPRLKAKDMASPKTTSRTTASVCIVGNWGIGNVTDQAAAAVRAMSEHPPQPAAAPLPSPLAVSPSSSISQASATVPQPAAKRVARVAKGPAIFESLSWMRTLVLTSPSLTLVRVSLTLSGA